MKTVLAKHQDDNASTSVVLHRPSISPYEQTKADDTPEILNESRRLIAQRQVLHDQFGRAAQLNASALAQGAKIRLGPANFRPITQLARYATTRSGRSTGPDFRTDIANVRAYFGTVTPSYTAASNSRAGGSHSYARLSPAALTAMGSDANSNLPSAIKDVKAAYRKITFIAGHLLNADFGGDGNNAKNLTVLTSKANHNHMNFDTPVKNALGSLRNAYKSMHEDGIDIKTVKVGIDISIAVTGAHWGSSYPHNCIFRALTCSANLQNSDAHDREFVERKNYDDYSRHIIGVKEHLASANPSGHVDNLLS